jgi:DNA-binding NtrC family response regulator
LFAPAQRNRRLMDFCRELAVPEVVEFMATDWIEESGKIPVISGLADTVHGLAPVSKSSISVLVVDDDRSLREACVNFFQVEGYEITGAGSGIIALDLVRRKHFDLVLLDLYMSEVPGMEILRAVLAAHKDTLVVVMTGNPSVESNLEAFHIGAWDYIFKPFTPTHLDVLVGRAVHMISKARDSRARAANEISEIGNSDLVSCLGVAPSFRKTVALARRVATTNASVMLCGESGTGKEVLAQLIHRHSRRVNKQLVPINCAALPENLLESEMFGHRKGAFTGADRDKPGLLEVANESTLFLDEITEMSLRLQAKLLRVLQDGIVRRVGGESQQTVDVRFISATNRDPQEAVTSGVLREDLFYRLRVVLIKLPPLRERVQDIPILANHFLSFYWERHRAREALPMFAEGSMDLLMSKEWRGNVRELQNVIEYLAVLAEPGLTIQPADIPFYETSSRDVVGSGIPSSLFEEGYHAAREKLVSNFERAYLSHVVDRAGGNMSKAARMASVDRTTLYRLIERYNPGHEGTADAQVPAER